MTTEVPVATQDMLTKITEMLVHQNETNTKKLGKGWSTAGADFNSAMIISSSRIINESEHGWKWWAPSATPVNVMAVKLLVVENFALLLSKFMDGSAEDKEYSINYLTPRLLGMFSMLNAPGANIFNGENIRLTTKDFLRRVLINEDLTVLSMTVVYQVLNAGMDFDELYKRFMVANCIDKIRSNAELAPKIEDQTKSFPEFWAEISEIVCNPENSEMYHSFEDIYSETLGYLIK